MPYERSVEEEPEEEPEDALPWRGFGRELEGIIVRVVAMCVAYRARMPGQTKGPSLARGPVEWVRGVQTLGLRLLVLV